MPAYQWIKVEERFDPKTGVSDLGYYDLLKRGMQPMEDQPISAGILGQLHVKELDTFAKTDDAPLLSTTTAAVNPIYGQVVYSWLNNEAPFLNALASQPWTIDGIRIKTANGTRRFTGLASQDALPAADKGTYALMRFPLKENATRYDWSMKLVSLQGNDAIPTPQQLAVDRAEDHQLGWSEAILADAQAKAAGAAANNAGPDTWETIDRIISSNAEYTDLKGTHLGWYNPYVQTATIDRTGTVYDSVVVHGDGTNTYQTGNPNFAVDATLSLDAKDVMLQQCLKNGLKRENGFWMTGYDTYFRLKQLYEVKERYMNPQKYTFSVNGVSTPNGAQVGFTLASMDDMPIIVDPNAPKTP